MPDPPPPGDVGAAWERTRLAWRRTVLAAAAVALLAARLAFVLTPGEAAGLVLGAAALVGWTGFAYLAARRMRALAARTAGPDRRPVVTAALAAVGYAAVGVGIVVVSLA